MLRLKAAIVIKLAAMCFELFFFFVFFFLFVCLVLRFRALNRLFREFREAPLSPVPPGESTKPGSVPHPRTDPNLVFFCRQVYDYRMGRIIKNPV